MTGNIESGEVVAAIHSLILRQGDAGRFQVRHIHSKDGAGADTKVGIDIKRCNLKASVEGLSARRSGAEVIVPIQEGEFIRGDFIDGGIPSIWKITIMIQFSNFYTLHYTNGQYWLK